jgi:hypothetical protein
MKTKITNEMIKEWEAESMIDALGNCLELNAEFIERYCGPNVKSLLTQIPESDREGVLQGCFGKAHFPGTVWDNDENIIMLPSGEIEFQFEGTPENVFETPSELTIHGDLAYLYTGYGLIIPIDCKKLAKNVAEILEVA